MANPTEDLRNKLKLEAKLRPRIKAYNEKLIREFRRQYKFDGNILNVDLFEDELNAILSDHYEETASIFSNRIIPDLPDDVPATEEEIDLIKSSLAIYFTGQALQTAKEINNTNQNELIASVDEAGEDELTDGLIGREKLIVTATLAAVFASRKLNARVGTIATTETQLGAETAKATEAEVLSGLQPSITGGTPAKVKVKKTWWSVGDSLVRSAHIKADGQERDLNKPYDVGGELLRHPRDPSLGASAGNLINCRCNSQPSKDDIIDVRRSARDMPDVQRPVPKPPKPITEPPKPKPPASPARTVTPKPKPTQVIEPIEVNDFKDPPSSPVRTKPDGVLPENVTKVRRKLTDNQRIQIKDYTEDGYRETNSFLRNPNKFSASTQKEFRAQVKSINGAIAKSELTEDVVLYRGTNSNKINSAMSKMKPGSKIPLSQFQSTSTSKASALEFTSGKESPVMFRIKAGKGTNALNLDQFKIESLRGEREILLSNSGEYTVKKVSKETGLFGQKVTVIDLDYDSFRSIKMISDHKIDNLADEIEISVPAVQRMYFSEQEMFYILLKNNDDEILESFLDG